MYTWYSTLTTQISNSLPSLSHIETSISLSSHIKTSISLSSHIETSISLLLPYWDLYLSLLPYLTSSPSQVSFSYLHRIPSPQRSSLFFPSLNFPLPPPLLYSAAKCLWITLISQFGHFDLFLKHTPAPPGIHWILRGDYTLLQVL